VSLRLTLAASLAMLAALPAQAANDLWLRQAAISPDGQQIAFTYQGNLFVVPSAGGAARVLVAHGGYSTAPQWSPDGSRIAYASDVNGNFDVYSIGAQGGASTRLTTHSANEQPLGFTPDGRSVLFSAKRMDAAGNAQFPTRLMSEVYRVSATEAGARPVQVLTTPALAAQYARDGQRLVYEDIKGYEDLHRKHHVSPVAHDVWLLDVASGKHTRLTSWGGENRNPVWAPDEQGIYYLSEQSGTLNVWQMPLGDPKAATQVTRFTRNPVRFLSAARDGTLCFVQDGSLYTLKPGAQPQPVALTIAADTLAPRVTHQSLTKGATEFAVSPDGSEVAFVLRGEVFVASTEFGDTRRITTTPGAERSVSFSPDGRRLLFAGEAGGSWNLYEAALPPGKAGRKQAPSFYAAAEVPVRTLLKNGRENFQPQYSPDGKEVAYLENRTTLNVLNLASSAIRTVMPGEMSYSYADGDQWFEWAPDGRSLVTTFVDRHIWGSEVGLADARGGKPLVNLTQSGYTDMMPKLARGGQVMVWLSDRAGLHGTSGSAQQDVFAQFLNREAYERYNLSKSEYATLVKQEEADKPDGDAKEEGKKGKAKDEDAITLPKPTVLELDGREQRIERLTLNSADIRDMVVTPDGESLLYLAHTADSVDLWRVKLREKTATKAASFPAASEDERGDGAGGIALQLDAKGETGFVLVGGALHKFKLPKEEGEIKPEALAFKAEFDVDHAAERAAMFEHVWRQTRAKLYVADMGGVDWDYYKQVYARFVPGIGTSRDFADLLAEMLGELNVSHTGSGYRPKAAGGDATAQLGLFEDSGHGGDGIKVAEVIAGGPLDRPSVRLRAGMVIERIAGSPVQAGRAWDALLNRQAGQRIALAVFDPATGQRWQDVVKPISAGEQDELLYQRWVRQRRAQVDQLSGGRLGYVHVRGMDDDSYRQVVSEALGRASGKEGLIVDTRFNGGGNLHDELATFLSGRRYLEFVPRGQSLGWEPSTRWTQPSVVLVSESNYSDAHLFPWVYKHQQIGKLVGMPVAGTGTAVWWETLQDDALYFGIPEVGFRDAKGEYMEKALVTPDVLVPHDPAELAKGRDAQLEAGVRVLLGR